MNTISLKFFKWLSSYSIQQIFNKPLEKMFFIGLLYRLLTKPSFKSLHLTDYINSYIKKIV